LTEVVVHEAQALLGKFCLTVQDCYKLEDEGRPGTLTATLAPDPVTGRVIEVVPGCEFHNISGAESGAR
jgi:hypothetical protein